MEVINTKCGLSNPVRKIYQEFISGNIIGVELEHNGYGGGDSGHGGYVRIKFKNLSGTDMSLNGERIESFELQFGGDAERDTLIEALKMIIRELERKEG